MATTLPQSALLHSSHNHLSRVFIGGVVVAGIALGGILAEGGRYVGERDCQTRVELCTPVDKPWLPDGSEKDPSNPLGKLTTGTVATSSASTLTSTTVVVPTTAAK
jgi:hypothetical protein